MDTGFAVTILNKAAWQRIGVLKLKPVSTIYRSFTGQPTLLTGVMKAEVQYGNTEKVLQVLVADSDCSISGRDWTSEDRLYNLSLQQLQENAVHSVWPVSSDQVFKAHEAVCWEELCCSKSFEAYLYLTMTFGKFFCKARPVPFPLREEVKQDLRRLEKDNLVSLVDYSEKGEESILAMRKQCKKVRECAGLSNGLSARFTPVSLPLPGEQFAKLQGEEQLRKIELKDISGVSWRGKFEIHGRKYAKS